jgi:histidinol-phosphate aminotransferase
MIKLDAMESPFPLPDELIGQYLAHLADSELNRYPNPSAIELQAISGADCSKIATISDNLSK